VSREGAGVVMADAARRLGRLVIIWAVARARTRGRYTCLRSSAAAVFLARRAAAGRSPRAPAALRQDGGGGANKSPRWFAHADAGPPTWGQGRLQRCAAGDLVLLAPGPWLGAKPKTHAQLSSGPAADQGGASPGATAAGRGCREMLSTPARTAKHPVGGNTLREKKKNALGESHAGMRREGNENAGPRTGSMTPSMSHRRPAAGRAVCSHGRAPPRPSVKGPLPARPPSCALGDGLNRHQPQRARTTLGGIRRTSMGLPRGPVPCVPGPRPPGGKAGGPRPS